MKCILVGDIFVSTDYMKEAQAVYKHKYTDIKEFYFGSTDRKEMREVVKKIEEEGMYSVKTPEGLAEEIKDADIIMVHLCPITKEMIDSAKNLKVILSNRGGTENIDLIAAKTKNITVLTNPAHNANAVAEHTIGLIINEQRNISRSHESLKQGIWREVYPNSSAIYELKNSTIGIIGYGNVGKLIVEKLSGFKMRIIVYDPYVESNTKNNNIEFVTLKQLLKESDIITLHARTTDKKPLIGKEELEKMKNTAYLINTARSYLVDMDALYESLKDNRICGAAIDVFEIEPLPKDYKFFSLDNVTLTNHRGGDTINSYKDSPLMLFDELERKDNNFIAT